MVAELIPRKKPPHIAIIDKAKGRCDAAYSVKSNKKDEGRKFDEGKLHWDLLPWDAIEKIVEILTYGAKKYEANNWQKITSDRYFAALMRHLVADQKGESFDEESGYLHLAHVACNALFLLWQKIQVIYNKKINPKDIFKMEVKKPMVPNWEK